MKRIHYFLIGMIIIFQSCVEQAQTGKKLFNDEFQWTILIPGGFEKVSAEQWAKIQNRGADAIEKTFDEKIDNRAKTIFVFKSDQLNYFESNYQPFDEAIDGNYVESCKTVNEMLYQTFVTQMDSIKIDTTTSVEMVDNLAFQTLKMKVTYPNKLILNILMFSRLFDKKELSVNIMYTDKTKGELILKSWKNSKFGHK